MVVGGGSRGDRGLARVAAVMDKVGTGECGIVVGDDDHEGYFGQKRSTLEVEDLGAGKVHKEEFVENEEEGGKGLAHIMSPLPVLPSVHLHSLPIDGQELMSERDRALSAQRLLQAERGSQGLGHGVYGDTFSDTPIGLPPLPVDTPILAGAYADDGRSTRDMEEEYNVIVRNMQRMWQSRSDLPSAEHYMNDQGPHHNLHDFHNMKNLQLHHSIRTDHGGGVGPESEGDIHAPVIG
jgi:hypothetical protein